MGERGPAKLLPPRWVAGGSVSDGALVSPCVLQLSCCVRTKLPVCLCGRGCLSGDRERPASNPTVSETATSGSGDRWETHGDGMNGQQNLRTARLCLVRGGTPASICTTTIGGSHGATWIKPPPLRPRSKTAENEMRKIQGGRFLSPLVGPRRALPVVEHGSNAPTSTIDVNNK